MRAFHFERDDWSLARRVSDNTQRVDLAKTFVRVFEQSPLMPADARLAAGIDVVDRRREPDGWSTRRRAGLNLVGRLPIVNAALNPPGDHFPATIERWHRFEMLVFAEERPNACRSVHLVAGKDIEIAA